MKSKNKKQTKRGKTAKTAELAKTTFMSIEDVLAELSSQIEQEIPKGTKRFARFAKQFNNRFCGDPGDYGCAAALAFSLLGAALQMYYVGHNASVFVELQGFVERFVLRDLPQHLARDRNSAQIIADMIDRKTLPELAHALQQLDVWSADDVTFAKKLTKVRNGIAHKNARLLSKPLGSGKNIHILDAAELVANADCVPYLLNSIELLAKLCKASGAYKKRTQENAQQSP